VVATVSSPGRAGAQAVQSGGRLVDHETGGRECHLDGKRPLEGPPPWYDLPCFFQVCPGCGASPFDMDWAHLVGEEHRPWMERDGFVGREGAGGRAAR
jgi:hypothetical protein